MIVQATEVVVGWVGLAIGSLARASSALRDYSYMDAAQKAASFVMEHMYDESSGTLRKVYRGGEIVEATAMAEDYAFLIKGGMMMLVIRCRLDDRLRSHECVG